MTETILHIIIPLCPCLLGLILHAKGLTAPGILTSSLGIGFYLIFLEAQKAISIQ